jgi:hypothetical protein
MIRHLKRAVAQPGPIHLKDIVKRLMSETVGEPVDPLLARSVSRRSVRP